MVEVIIIKPEDFAKDQRKKTIPEQGEIYDLKNTTAQRLMKQGIIDLTSEELAKVKKENNKKIEKEKLKAELKTELKKEEIIEKYFSKENPKFDRLGAVINKDSFAYGQRIYIEDKDIFVNGLITDKQEVLLDLPKVEGVPIEKTSQIKYCFGIHYNTDFEEPDFPWTNKGIKQYLSGEIKNVDKNEIYNKIIDLQNKGIIWGDNEKYRPIKITCKIIASYFHPIWICFERDSDVGHSTAGKSKKQLSSYHLGFNTLKIAKQTEADLYRSLDATCGWVFADNVDYQTKEQQDMTNTIIEVGWDKKGGYARTRINNKKSGRFEVEKKAISGFMSFTSINQLDNNKTATRNRMDLNYNQPREPNSLTKEEKQKYNYDYDKDNEFLKTAEELRTELRILALENWRTIKEIYQTIKTPFVGRMDNNTRPILTIAKWLSEEIYSDVIKYYLEQEKQLKLDSIENDSEFEFYEELAKILWYRKKGAIFSVKGLIDLWYELNYASYEIGSEKKTLKYKAQKELPKKLKEASCFQRIKIGNNANGWKIGLKDIEYLRLSRGYTSIDEVKETLTSTISKTDNLHNLRNLSNIANLDNITIDFKALIPLFEALEGKITISDLIVEKLSELPKLSTLHGEKKEKTHTEDKNLNEQEKNEIQKESVYYE